MGLNSLSRVESDTPRLLNPINQFKVEGHPIPHFRGDADEERSYRAQEGMAHIVPLTVQA